ncbi:ATP-binding cassette domain-containing protein [Christensenella tenuis]|jgi:cobalt/nickel transport system ATP-binding protein|uniref:ABC transporter ATP-binding protein n=1 Tax=Christensenella tenuis TaxID=2763033 RepID=A0ABR7EHE8_9FIRM|nr:ATP-binding cassette domain-containing protein [Christensenella tenuis]MBC5649190.1 ATP-binding cassette domain-containing protein [Christensenella tenuis]
MDIIKTEGLSYCYEENSYALKQISITVPKEKTTAFLGGNGAGKSTFFLNLNGVFTPTEGEVYFKGEKINYKSKKVLRELRKKVGIVFQDPNDQLFSADVLSDISYGPLNLGCSEEETKAIVEDVVKWLAIEEFLDKPTHALSFGQKKRAALAGVLAMRPEVIILDEPTAGLDPSGVSEMLKLLNQLKKEKGLTVMLSTHDIDMIPLCCDYVYVFDHGKVVMAGECGEVFSQPEKLREHNLRLPRLSHLMEILQKEDGFDVDVRAATISEARRSIKGLF